MTGTRDTPDRAKSTRIFQLAFAAEFPSGRSSPARRPTPVLPGAKAVAWGDPLRLSRLSAAP